MNSKRIFFVSGISPSNGGTGRLVSEIEVYANHTEGVTFISSGKGIISLSEFKVSKDYKRLLTAILKRMYFFVFVYLYSFGFFKNSDLVILHPQSLGYSIFENLVKNSRGHAWLYVLDNSFFCLKSYNKIYEENYPCFRCLNLKTDSAKQFNCTSLFKYNFEEEKIFQKNLDFFVNEGKLKVFAQNLTQWKLLQKQFGDNLQGRIVGLWARDFHTTSNFESKKQNFNSKQIIYHGTSHHAKGAGWLIQVARHAKELEFIFPFEAKEILETKPSNCNFIPMTWETGLRDYLLNSQVVCVPSLWSAPIEGALVKSLQISNTVAVAENPTSFSAEIPKDHILVLDLNPELAARQLENSIASTVSNNLEWINQFETFNSQFVHNMVVAVKSEG